MSIYKLNVTGPQDAGDLWTSGIHANGSLSVGGALAAWGVELETALGAGGVSEYWAPSTHVRGISVYTLNATTGLATAVATGTLSLDGLGAAEQPSPRDCVVVGFRTATPGPGGRGRMYLPGVSNDNLTAGGLISEASRTAMAADMAGLVTNLASDGLVLGIWRPGMSSVDPFVSITIGAVPGSQRRRSNKIPNSYVVDAI